MKKKIISLLLSLIMVVTMVPCVSFAEEIPEETDTEQTVATEEEAAVPEEVVEQEEVEKPKPVVLKKPVVKAKGTSYTKIKISWKKVTGAKGYKVYRYNSSKKKYVLIKTITSGNTLSYINTKRKANTKYKYRVKAYAYDNGKKVYSSYGYAKSSPKPRYKTMKVKAWAYSGKGRTATGKKVKKGYIAVDPKVIKLHSKVYVPGYGYARAEDTGGNIKGKKIDVYYPTNKQCRKWGVKYVKIRVYY